MFKLWKSSTNNCPHSSASTVSLSGFHLLNARVLYVCFFSSLWCRPVSSMAASCSVRWSRARRWRCAPSRCGIRGWSLTSTCRTCPAWAACASHSTPSSRRPRSHGAPRRRTRKRWVCKELGLLGGEPKFYNLLLSESVVTLVGARLLVGANRSVSSPVYAVCSCCVLCGCVLLLRLVVQVYSVARLRLTFHLLQPFYLLVTPRKEGIGRNIQGILSSSPQSLLHTQWLNIEPFPPWTVRFTMWGVTRQPFRSCWCFLRLLIVTKPNPHTIWLQGRNVHMM